MELIGAGRTAEVFALGRDRVVKLDRVGWDGLSHYEAVVIAAAQAAGLPVPEVYDTVVLDGRHGVVLERLDGPSLTEVIRRGDDPTELARAFTALHRRLHDVSLADIPNLVPTPPSRTRVQRSTRTGSRRSDDVPRRTRRRIRRALPLRPAPGQRHLHPARLDRDRLVDRRRRAGRR